ncbi:MAG TPA: hypothetical protein DCL60_10295 [Armatimonadetes bacterium]|nr:hypothetical protein [Armatimonadota bacterium]
MGITGLFLFAKRSFYLSHFYWHRDNGNFHFIIEEYLAPRKNWRDGKNRNRESFAGDIIEWLYECANALKVHRENANLGYMSPVEFEAVKHAA